MFILSAFFLFLRSLLQSRISLATEILVLRQQLAVINRTVKRPQLHRRDWLFWVILSRIWNDWREVLIIVQPETVIKWHRTGFRLYWRWKSKAPIGRPPIDPQIRELIRRISRENPLWECPASNRNFASSVSTSRSGPSPNIELRIPSLPHKPGNPFSPIMPSNL